MKRLLLMPFLATLSFLALGQGKYQVTGKVTDSLLNTKLENASASILNAKDSTLVSFAWADANGNFRIDNLRNGKFILLLSYPDYADYVQRFSLDSPNNGYDFGEINLSSKVHLLNEVIIKGKVAAIKMKGDTTEFNARAFVIQPNAKVEDLLKQLPGIQVDNNGKITAHGQVVKKVLVDGEEFFGDDPTLVTRNLRGDMIDKVQLYDKKSDQATFTGVDDGIKEKTINLKLKEDKKKGYFGKMDAGLGTTNFYQTQAMVNLFREKYKIAVYGNSSNTGRNGLSSSENSKYGTDGGAIEFVSGGVTLTGSNADEIESSSGRYNGQGLPLANTSGGHYDGKWNKDKESINMNVKIGALQVDGERNTITQNDLPTGLMLSNSTQNFSNNNFRQRFDAAYQMNFNPSTSLKIKIDGINKQSESENNYDGSILDHNYILLNRSTRKLTNDGNQKAININAFYSRKLKRQGRTFSWNLTQVMTQDNTQGYLKAINDFYINSKLSSTEKVDQYKTDEKAVNAFNSNLTFSEPLSKTLTMVMNYRLGLVNSATDRKSFNPSGTGSYTILDTDFSNDFKVDQFSNQAGATVTYQKEKRRVALGGKVTMVDLSQLDRYTHLKYNRNFLNFNPQASYAFRPSSQKSFQMSYNGSTIQPTIDQIQPVKINTDPLNLVEGNADLNPAFTHGFEFSYNSYKALSGFSINLISSYNVVDNPIVSSVQVDASGKSIYQAVNLESKSLTSFVLRGDFGKQVKSIAGFLGWNFFFTSRVDYGITNSAINRRKSNLLTSSFQFSKFREKKYDLMLGIGPRFFTGSSSLQNQFTNNGYGYDGYLNLNIYFPYKLEFRSSSTASYQSKTESFNQAYQAVIINASIGKKLLRDETLKFSISANDILNQNIGFNRNSFGTMVTQNQYTTIARYFMCTLTWDFSKFGKTLAQ